MFLHIRFLMKSFATVVAWVGPGVAVYEKMGGQGAAPLEGLPALGTLNKTSGFFELLSFNSSML